MPLLPSKDLTFNWRLVGYLAAVAGVALLAYLIVTGRLANLSEAEAPNKATLPLVSESPNSPEARTVARPVTAGTASAPKAAPMQEMKAKPLNFNSAEDLYALASSAANSSDPMTAYNGYLALRSCTGVVLRQDELEKMVALGGNSPEAIERVRSASIVLRRCAGFFNNDRAANIELLKRLGYGFRSKANSYYGDPLGGGPPTDEQFAEVIVRGDWHTFSWLMSEMMPRARASASIKPDSEDDLYFSTAWLQANCDLGNNCTASGLSYLISCADFGRCLGSWENTFVNGLSEKQRAAVSDYRNQIVQAFLSKNMKFFGLGP